MITMSHDSKEVSRHSGAAWLKVRSLRFYQFSVTLASSEPTELSRSVEGERKEEGRRRGSRDGGRGMVMGAVSLGDVPDQCWSQKQDWLGLCVSEPLCTHTRTHTRACSHTQKHMQDDQFQHISVVDLRQTCLNVKALTNCDASS